MPRLKARPAPSSDPAASPDDAPLPHWVQAGIAKGKYTEEEYRAREAELLAQRRERLERGVPPLVESEGPAAVADWVEEWLVRDPRLFLLGLDTGPRAPLP